MQVLKIFLFFLCFGLLICCSPRENKNQETLDLGIARLDSTMRSSQIDSALVVNTLQLLSSNFPFSYKTEFEDEIWKASGTLKWNNDSSITMITLRQYNDTGLEHETILHINDSILFIKRFLAGPSYDSTEFTFVESYDYLTIRRTIKTLVRIKNLERLSDSAKFRSMPFEDVSASVEDHYEFELNYCRNILDLN